MAFLWVKKWALCWKWGHGFTLIAAINLRVCQHHEWGYFLPSINIGLICIFISKIGKYHMRVIAEGHFMLCSKSGRCCWDFSSNQICYEVPKPLTAFLVGLLNLSLLTRFWKRGEQAKLLTHKGHLENEIINMHKTGWNHSLFSWQNSKILYSFVM